MANSSDNSDGQSRVKRARRATGENRARLISAAISEFGSKGFHGASTADIGKVADVPQPHVYANFKSKLDLFEACLVSVDEGLRHENDAFQGELATEQTDLTLSRFLFQAIASVESLPDSDLAIPLAKLRDDLGDRFNRLILRAASSYCE